MRFVVTTFYDQNYKQLAEKTNPNHQAYCDRHGYEYMVKELPGSFKGDGYHALCEMGKTNADYIVETLNKTKTTDWIFTIGCDAVITEMNLKLESIIEYFEGYQIITGSDWDGINSSQMIIQNANSTYQYFRRMRDLLEWNKIYIGYYYEHDQHFLKTNPRDFMIESPQRFMNSYDHELRKEQFDKSKHWFEGCFLVHMAGSTLEQRMDRVDYWLGKAK